MASTGILIENASNVCLEDCEVDGFEQGFVVHNSQNIKGTKLRSTASSKPETPTEPKKVSKVGNFFKASASVLALGSNGIGIYEKGQKTGLW